MFDSNPATINKVIIVMGGSFSPSTNAHFSLGQQLADEYEIVEKILYTPVGNHYEKPGLINAEHRYNMLKAVCDKNEKFDVSRVEIDSERQLYTIETLERIQIEYPNHQIWFTIGTDNFKQIPSWKMYKDLISKFQLLVLERDEDKMETIIAQNPELCCYKHNFIKAKETIRSNCSSTILRDKIKHGKSIQYLVPDEVWEYVSKNKLFLND